MADRPKQNTCSTLTVSGAASVGPTAAIAESAVHLFGPRLDYPTPSWHEVLADHGIRSGALGAILASARPSEWMPMAIGSKSGTRSALNLHHQARA